MGRGRVVGSKNAPKGEGVCKYCNNPYTKTRALHEYCSRQCYRYGTSTAKTHNRRGMNTRLYPTQLDKLMKERNRKVMAECKRWKKEECGNCTIYLEHWEKRDRLGCTRKPTPDRVDFGREEKILDN